MPVFHASARLWRLLGGRPPPVLYSPHYRLPISGLESKSGMELRRADYVAWFLVQTRTVLEREMHEPPKATWEELARAHLPGYLESLTDRRTLAHIYAVDPSDVPVEEVLTSVRLVTGGTIAAARLALDLGRSTFNLMGGAHHAGPESGGGFCAVNDIAVAIGALRAAGFEGRVWVLDLDAHPPDGTAACVRNDEKVSISSISGSDWGPLPPNVDEVVLPEGTGDEAYLAALDALLKRAPNAELTFVIAGGDVLGGDRFGMLGLTLHGARQRDLRVARHLGGKASVWLPGGGYHRDSWRLLASTGLVLAGRRRHYVSRQYDPLARHFDEVARSLPFSALTGQEELLSQDDVDELFGGGRGGARSHRLLGFYTREGMEFAFEHYGLLRDLRRLGYRDLGIELHPTGTGDQLRVTGVADYQRHVLVETVLDRKRLGDEEFLFVNWLALRNPKARFSELRPRLPGQEVPGLGMAREASEMFLIVARRLGLAGVAFKPAWYHMAYAGRSKFRFLDPARQGEFEALLRDLKGIPLIEATRALADGRVRTQDGASYAWKADEMVFRLEPRPTDAEERATVERVRDSLRFTIDPGPAPAATADRPLSGDSG